MGLTAFHPGEHLAVELETLGRSAAELERKIGVPTTVTRRFCMGRAPLRATRLSASDTSSESEINADAVFKLGHSKTSTKPSGVG